MKIIRVSNFNNESVSDVLIAENVHHFYIKNIVYILNEMYSGNVAPDYFRAVEDDYKLYIFEP